jgi:hypothetical protein
MGVLGEIEGVISAAQGSLEVAQEGIDRPELGQRRIEQSGTDPGTDPYRTPIVPAWALLLARICEVFPLLCPKCGAEMRMIAFITEAPAARQILAHLGEPTSPPRLAPARGPPLWEMPDAGKDRFDPQAQPAPDYEFDQRIAW